MGPPPSRFVSSELQGQILAIKTSARVSQSWSVLLRICKEAHMHTHHITPSREYVNSVRVRHLPVQMRRITQPVERLPLQK